MAQVDESDVVFISFDVAGVQVRRRTIGVIAVLHVAVSTAVDCARVEVGVCHGRVIALRPVEKRGAVESSTVIIALAFGRVTCIASCRAIAVAAALMSGSTPTSSHCTSSTFAEVLNSTAVLLVERLYILIIYVNIF